MHGATRSPVNASVAAAAAGDVDVDAEVAAWQVQEGQGVVQAALDDPLETGSGANVRLDVGGEAGGGAGALLDVGGEACGVEHPLAYDGVAGRVSGCVGGVGWVSAGQGAGCLVMGLVAGGFAVMR